MNAALLIATDDEMRADCYRVLARLFAAPPDAALVSTLADAARGADDELGSAWNELCTLATRVGADDTALGRLADEYSELFFSVGEPRVMLYGSWYQSGSLMDVPLARLRDDLAKLGFERDPQVREPEDHLAALLEVMAMLVADGRAEQADFFRRHLAPWYAHPCQRLEADNSEFYRAAARFAHGVLDVEKELLAR
ncbi:MAG: molecular chaperone TorD family protein [Sulfuritalea sp.]|jgi:TorA maturation chaperone TorD|nr:molecular chaperone TorD family protein [Sulfuritalea sp.]